MTTLFRVFCDQCGSEDVTLTAQCIVRWDYETQSYVQVSVFTDDNTDDGFCNTCRSYTIAPELPEDRAKETILKIKILASEGRTLV